MERFNAAKEIQKELFRLRVQNARRREEEQKITPLGDGEQAPEEETNESTEEKKVTTPAPSPSVQLANTSMDGTVASTPLAMDLKDMMEVDSE